MPPSSSFLALLLLFLFFFSFFCTSPPSALCKSTIEPCAGSDACPALVAYTLYADLKLSEVAALFQADPAALLAANAVDFSLPDAADRILPAGLPLRVPLPCACADGIRKCVSVRYRARPADTLASIAASVYAGLVSPDQIREANGITDPDAVEAGRTLAVPLPCSCFNSTDNMLPAVFLSYVVRGGDTVSRIASAYATTVTDIMNVNAMASPAVKPGDILAIPLPACASPFSKDSSDYGLIVANGSYAITASRCIQCSCGPEDLNLYCTPASLAVPCSSMQCRNSNLMLGSVTSQFTSAGCSVTSCTYGGFANGTIITTLSTSLQPRCPGQHKFPSLIPLPSAQIHESIVAPSLSPSSSGGIQTMTPKSLVPATMSLPAISPANGSAGSIPGNISQSPSHIRMVPWLSYLLISCLLFRFLL